MRQICRIRRQIRPVQRCILRACVCEHPVSLGSVYEIGPLLLSSSHTVLIGRRSGEPVHDRLVEDMHALIAHWEEQRQYVQDTHAVVHSTQNGQGMNVQRLLCSNDCAQDSGSIVRESISVKARQLPVVLIGKSVGERFDVDGVCVLFLVESLAHPVQIEEISLCLPCDSHHRLFEMLGQHPVFQDMPQEDFHIQLTILGITFCVKLRRPQSAQRLRNGHLGPSGHKHLEPLGKPREVGLDQMEELILLVVLRFVEGVDDEHLAAFHPNRSERLD
mmetsp:Transcript_32079/g.102257  ORF Transcript_32079/g.102257 Transcript_32079/m.102257 type:complete len:275 (+) Transcript_32079:150-974(+)